MGLAQPQLLQPGIEFVPFINLKQKKAINIEVNIQINCGQYETLHSYHDQIGSLTSALLFFHYLPAIKVFKVRSNVALLKAKAYIGTKVFP